MLYSRSLRMLQLVNDIWDFIRNVSEIIACISKSILPYMVRADEDNTEQPELALITKSSNDTSRKYDIHNINAA